MSARIQSNQIKKASLTAHKLALRLKRGTMRINEEGELEKRCSKCKEFWPADNEFFFSGGGRDDGLTSWCKACYVEWRFPEGRGSVGHEFHKRAA